MFWDDILDALLGGDDSPSSGGGLMAAWQVALGAYTSQIPGPLGTIAGYYLTSGINFDDPSGIAGAQAAADRERRDAALQQLSLMFVTVGDDTTAASRQSTGQLMYNAGFAETASGRPSGESTQAEGRIDESDGLARAPLGRGTATDDSLDASGRIRQLQRLDRGSSSDGPDIEPSTGVQKNLTATPGKSDEFDYLRPRPENIPTGRGELVWTTDPVTPPQSTRRQSTPISPSPEPILEVVVRGTKPNRPPAPVPFLIEPSIPSTPPIAHTARIEHGTARRAENRSFWERGGSATVVKDGDTYTITGEGVGAPDMSNPTAPSSSKFDITFACSTVVGG